MATATTYPHIELNEAGKPVISGTRTKVRMIAEDTIYGCDIEEIRHRYPYLSLGQIHSALAYYYDHKEEIDRDIEEGERLVEELKARQGESPVRKKLRDRGLIP